MEEHEVLLLVVDHLEQLDIMVVVGLEHLLTDYLLCNQEVQVTKEVMEVLVTLTLVEEEEVLQQTEQPLQQTQEVLEVTEHQTLLQVLL
jgi:hypothetical protein